MAPLLALTLALIVFVVSLKWMRAEEIGRGVLVTARTATATISDKTLTDEQKEARVRRASGQLLGSFFRILLVGVVALGLSLGLVWLGGALGFYTHAAAIALASGGPFLIGSTVAAVALWLALSRKRSDVPYSRLDRALHRVAFAAPGLQKAMARSETQRYADRINPATAARPVFVTSLARAGTTILLDTLARHPDFASATYRQMPFALAPLMWSDLTRNRRQDGTLTERAHGDGIMVGFDSPEAFEEMVWLAFWRDHYRDDRITAWGDETNAEFETFFRDYRAKIVATKAGATRYLSKNNANIARLPLLERLQPDATILIPVRDPFVHAASLLRQHERFTDLHAREPFAQRYMEGIGHFEFGAALRPISFDGTARDGDPTAFDYWLTYWADCYEGVLDTAGPRAVFSDHDALSTDPARHLPVLAEALEIDAAPLMACADRFRAPKPAPQPAVPPALAARVHAIHDTLQTLCLK